MPPAPKTRGVGKPLAPPSNTVTSTHIFEDIGDVAVNNVPTVWKTSDSSADDTTVNSREKSPAVKWKTSSSLADYTTRTACEESQLATATSIREKPAYLFKIGPVKLQPQHNTLTEHTATLTTAENTSPASSFELPPLSFDYKSYTYPSPIIPLRPPRPPESDSRTQSPIIHSPDPTPSAIGLPEALHSFINQRQIVNSYITRRELIPPRLLERTIQHRLTLISGLSHACQHGEDGMSVLRIVRRELQFAEETFYTQMVLQPALAEMGQEMTREFERCSKVVGELEGRYGEKEKENASGAHAVSKADAVGGSGDKDEVVPLELRIRYVRGV